MVRDDYMVTEACWQEAGFLKADHVHVKCLETELDRPLVYKDFNEGVINDKWTCRMKLPCAYCLFEELKKRYTCDLTSKPGWRGTLTKLALVNPWNDTHPKAKIVTDRCTCNEL
jgi:hypothetical protein